MGVTSDYTMIPPDAEEFYPPGDAPACQDNFTGISRIVFGVFFALSISTIPVQERAGLPVLLIWGAALPVLALLTCLLIARIGTSLNGRQGLGKPLRDMLRSRLAVSLFAFFASALPYQAGYIAGDFCRDVAWLLCLLIVLDFFRDRCRRALIELALLLPVAVVLQNVPGSSAFPVLGIGGGFSWFCRGICEAFGRTDS